MELPASTNRVSSTSGGVVKSPLDVGGGLFLLVLAAFGLAGGFDLPFGTLSGIGSGLMPRVVAVLVAAFGVLLVVQGLLWEGDRLERWHVRGPVFVLGAVLVFAMVIRGSTLTLGGFAGLPALASIKIPSLGLVVAGPLSVMFSSLATKETRPIEIIVYAITMTLISGILFKELLHLPIPFDPAGIVPGPVNDFYEGLKAVLGHLVSSIRSLIVR